MANAKGVQSLKSRVLRFRYSDVKHDFLSVRLITKQESIRIKSAVNSIYIHTHMCACIYMFIDILYIDTHTFILGK